MSKTQKQKAETVHGEVEYDVVECSSCGSEIMEKDAHRFVVAKDPTRTDWSERGYIEYRFHDHKDYAEGYACEFCREGPAAYPDRHRVDEFEKFALYVVGTFVATTAAFWLIHAV